MNLINFLHIVSYIQLQNSCRLSHFLIVFWFFLQGRKSRHHDHQVKTDYSSIRDTERVSGQYKYTYIGLVQTIVNSIVSY